jgi:hypothetical protein
MLSMQKAKCKRQNIIIFGFQFSVFSSQFKKSLDIYLFWIYKLGYSYRSRGFGIFVVREDSRGAGVLVYCLRLPADDWSFSSLVHIQISSGELPMSPFT